MTSRDFSGVEAHPQAKLWLTKLGFPRPAQTRWGPRSQPCNLLFIHPTAGRVDSFQLEERIHVAQPTIAITMNQSLKLTFRANLNIDMNRITTASAVNKMNMQLVTTTHGP